MGRLLLFKGMPKGYSGTMKVFKKLLESPFSISKSHEYLSVVFADDFYLQGPTFSTYEDNVNATVDLLQFPCFIIHPEKSVLVPTQEIEFLGFLLNSLQMKTKLTDCKSRKIMSKIF